MIRRVEVKSRRDMYLLIWIEQRGRSLSSQGWGDRFGGAGGAGGGGEVGRWVSHVEGGRRGSEIGGKMTWRVVAPEQVQTTHNAPSRLVGANFRSQSVRYMMQSTDERKQAQPAEHSNLSGLFAPAPTQSVAVRGPDCLQGSAEVCCMRGSGVRAC